MPLTNPLDPTVNFGLAPLASGISAVDTTLTLTTGYGALFPNPATDGEYNLPLWDDFYSNPTNDPDKEIIRVTAKSGDVLTIIRAQEGTTAVAHNTGGKTYKVGSSITKKMITDIGTLIQRKGGQYATSGGSANAQTLSVNANITAYEAGDTFCFLAGYSCTDTCTLNVNSIGAKTIYKNSGETLVYGDIMAGDSVCVIYDGINLRLQSYIQNDPATITRFSTAYTIKYSDIPFTLSASLANIVYLMNSSGLLYKSGTLQSIAGTALWASSTNTLNSIIVGGYIYVYLIQTATAAQIYRCSISSDISVAGNWTQITISGTALPFAGASGFVGFDGTNFWITDGSAGFIKYSLSGTTFTSISTVTVTGSSYFASTSVVNSAGIYAGFTSAPYVRFAAHTGTLDTTKQISQSTLIGFGKPRSAYYTDGASTIYNKLSI